MGMFAGPNGSNIHGKFQTGESCAGEEGQHGSPAEPRFFGLLVLVDRTDLGSRKAGKASTKQILQDKPIRQ